MEAEPLPTPGHALVGLRPMFHDYEGPLYIPENARSMKSMGRIGVVCAVTPYPENQLSWVYERGLEVAREAWRHNQQYISMLGKHAVCRSAVLLYGMLYSVRLEHLECVVPEEAKASEDELGRCRKCKAPHGELGVLLGPDGYCPNCGLNTFDEHFDDQLLKAVTEWEIDQLVRKPMEMAHFMDTGGKALKGNAISYPGQKNRGTVTPADDKDLNEFMRNMKGKG